MPKLLTPEQKKSKKESQKRWLEKKRLSQKTIETCDTAEIMKTCEIPLEAETTPDPIRPLPDIFPMLETVLKVSLCISITSLLIYFQAQAYSEKKTLEPLSIAMSVICEISLLYLSVSLRRSFVSCFLFGCLFLYNLGVMSFSVMRDETKKTLSEIREDPKEVMKRSIFQKALSSYDLSSARKETGNVTKILKIMKDISEEPIKIERPMLELYKIEASGLIILRAILMLLNAVLIHRIFKWN